MPHARSVELIVERQAKLWEERQALSHAGGEAARRALVHLSEGPWITLSRQLGTGGADFGRRLADRLGWQVYDHEILERIARQTHTAERILARLDEHAVGRLRDILAHFMLSGASDQPAFLREMTRVIFALARQGKAIIRGRGANWLLDHQYGLRVRLIAPQEVRVKRLARVDRITAAEAERRVRQHDLDMQAFTRQVFRRDIDDPHGYDLILNIATLPLEAAVEATTAALHGKLGSQEHAAEHRAS
ncbi:MAG TPA: cytidylate kinase-like family protein [Candidatus Polarisedimenticolia bacterium]|nr:cytidylate kinase-like family protein [Candidatus Polarisedimenticolia bacterium]